MPENLALYRLGLSVAGAVIMAGLGLILGAVWSLAMGADLVLGALGVGAVAAVWGAIVVQLTPTGGVIMENKTTVNYAVFALHGWYTFFFSLVALIFWGLRVWVL
jgi:hypothetical protein